MSEKPPVIKLLFGCLLLCTLFVACKKDEMLVPQNDADQVLEKINLLRQTGCNCGTDYMPPVVPLLLNVQLENAALAHTKDMAQRNYLDHVSPEGNTPQERAVSAGYKGDFKTENIGRGYVNADEVMAAWKNSVSHCKAMMDAASKEAGAGFSRNYWAVSFGTP